ncbi:MAG: hypothetical protein JXA37_05690 [Chloroflexia bacterium]|nr:hypothetical protein [Chloroflexia bacterium]
MCGLAGILLHPQERTPEQWQQLRELFSQTLLYNQERGREASGVALIQTDGDFRLFKQPLAASDLLQTARYREILAQLGPRTSCLLGHTRMPTKGSRWNNANNHPLLVGRVLGVHNGVIQNDDDLFARLQLPRRGQVDSEIIFRLLNGIESYPQNGQLPQAVQQVAQQLDGPFATLSVDLRRPREILVLKHLRPLCFHYEAELQAVFFSSRYLFLRKAFGRSVLTEALDSDHGFVFDAESLPQCGGRPRHNFALEWPQESE